MARIRQEEFVTKRREGVKAGRKVITVIKLTRPTDVEAAKQLGIVPQDFSAETLPVNLPVPDARVEDLNKLRDDINKIADPLTMVRR